MNPVQVNNVIIVMKKKAGDLYCNVFKVRYESAIKQLKYHESM